MSSTGKFTLSGDASSKKHSEPSGLSVGDPHSKKSKGDASASSPGLSKPIDTTCDSPGVSTGVSNSKKPDGK